MKRLRFKFVWRFGGTNREHWSRKIAEKYRETKRIHRFREIQGFTPQKTKNDFSHDLSQSPRYRYYSSANRSTSHMKIGDRGDPVFFGHVGGRLLAYFGHGNAF